MTWAIGSAPVFNSAQIAPGEPGFDVSSAGVLEIGGDTATSVELGPANVIISGTGAVLASSAQVQAGNPGIDTLGAGALALGPTNATSIAITPHIVSLTVGTPATSGLVANLTSATPAGNDTRGIITLVVAAGGIAAGSSLCTVTFATSYGATAPRVLVVNENATNLANVNFFIVSQSTGVSFVLGNSQALVVGTYVVGYIVIG